MDVKKSQKLPPLFQVYQSDISHINLPARLNFPFYYDPHELCKIAATEVQKILTEQQEWVHNFGIDPKKEGMVIGKMFGVLVVQSECGTIGFLAAFSGKLAERNHIDPFVPTVYDMLTKDGHFRTEEKILNAYNEELESLCNNEDYLRKIDQLKQVKEEAQKELSEIKELKKKAKKERKKLREEALDLLEEERTQLFEKLRIESIKSNYFLKDKIAEWDKKISDVQYQVDKYQHRIDELKVLRKIKSNELQQYLFSQYKFLNQEGEEKSLLDIFKSTQSATPPAGAGECAAPKLFQYAFQHKLKPLSIAEFWWGQSPKSEVRKHKHYYPACRGKCEPILQHMLQGVPIESNPMLSNPAKGKKLSIVHEDDEIIIINKPYEFLSVPGKNIEDSVWTRMKSRLPNATGPLIVHRLDMSTSGLMIIAKTKDTHKYLQRQFLKRTVKKRYVALLDGIPEEQEGIINLPLRVDLNNRPQQLVCHQHGKTAITKWTIIGMKGRQAKVFFYPQTGRTHQLRVHAAHHKGLNCPIVGDDLYGQKGKRLHLHAQSIQFIHPLSRQWVSYQVDPDF